MADISILKILLFEVWITGLVIGLKIVLAVFTIVVLVQIIWSACRYVTDMAVSEDYEKRKRKLFFGNAIRSIPYDLPYSRIEADELGEGYEAFIVYAFFGVVGSAIWPAVVVYTAIHGSLFLARAALRFKKKVYKALENKADKDHKH